VTRWHGLCLAFAVAVTAEAQWRHFGKESEFARDMLAAHNTVRARVGVAPLEWSDRLAARAQEWADHLVEHRQFYHRPSSEFGENLFAISGSTASPDRVVEDWASESRGFNYRSNSCRGVCGHYTQLVWRDTTEIGCAVARGSGREVWVCNYYPSGNWIGQRPY